MLYFIIECTSPQFTYFCSLLMNLLELLSKDYENDILKIYISIVILCCRLAPPHSYPTARWSVLARSTYTSSYVSSSDAISATMPGKLPKVA